MFLRVLCAFVVLLSPFTFAASKDKKPAELPKGISVMDSRGVEAFDILGQDAWATFVNVKDQPFTRVARIQTFKRPAKPQHLQFKTKTTQPIKKGDALVAIFYARVVEPPASGAPQGSFVFENASKPYTKSADFPFKLGTSWQRFNVPFSALEDQEPGSAQIMFRLGYDPQTIEIGGLQVLNFGAGINPDRLPSSR